MAIKPTGIASISLLLRRAFGECFAYKKCRAFELLVLFNGQMNC